MKALLQGLNLKVWNSNQKNPAEAGLLAVINVKGQFCELTLVI